MNNQGETERNRLVVERRQCRHCNKSLSLKTYKAHKRRFYDSANDVWFTKESMTLQPENDSSDNESPPSVSEMDYESMDEGNCYIPPSPPALSK